MTGSASKRENRLFSLQSQLLIHQYLIYNPPGNWKQPGQLFGRASRRADRLQGFHIAGATTEIAAQRLLNLLDIRRWIAGEQGMDR